MKKKSAVNKILLSLYLILVITLQPIFLSLSGNNLAITQASAAGRPVVFLMPHQDDEMFMAGSIRSFLFTDRPVHVVMVTAGNSSAARDEVNGVVYCGWHKRYHNLRQEGSSDPDRNLSLKDFSFARNREFYGSMTALGVPAANIHFANDEVPEAKNGLGETWSSGWTSPRYNDDGTFSKRDTSFTKATEVIDYYVKKYPTASFKTVAGNYSLYGISETNYTNLDHSALRVALGRYVGTTDKAYYSDKPIGTTITLNADQKAAKARALNNYYAWKPSSGRYAVGYHSVPDLLNKWKSYPYEYVVVDKTVPANATNLSLTPADGKVTLKWTKPSTYDLAGFLIVRKASGTIAKDRANGTVIYQGGATSFVDTGVTNENIYSYRIWAYDASGNYSTGTATGVITLPYVDHTAPSVSNLITSTNTTQATITWLTDEKATAFVEYGTTTAYGQTIENTSFLTTHAITISNLQPSTTYHFKLKSKDAAGNTVLSGDYSFQTK